MTVGATPTAGQRRAVEIKKARQLQLTGTGTIRKPGTERIAHNAKKNNKKGRRKMLYDEFLKGTKAQENSRTYAQYETIEKIYNECENMTKEESYKLWRQTYGKQEKINRDRLLKSIKDMSEYRDTDDATPEQMKTRRLLFQTAASLTECNEFQAGYTARINTPDNVTYSFEKYREVNGHKLMRLYITFEGKRYGTALVYFFGDLRIHAAPENLPKV